MRKIGCVLAALCLVLCCSGTAFADSTVITVEVPQPSYQLSIPSGSAMGYGDASCTLGVPTVTAASGFREGMGLKLSVSYSGSFSSPGVSSVIPYRFAFRTGNGELGWNSGDCLYFSRTEDGGLTPNGHTAEGAVPEAILLYVSPADWQTAYPGSYAAVINYSASVTME